MDGRRNDMKPMGTDQPQEPQGMPGDSAPASLDFLGLGSMGDMDSAKPKRKASRRKKKAPAKAKAKAKSARKAKAPRKAKAGRRKAAKGRKAAAASRGRAKK